ncbi:MAG: type II toxin-antitoxin system VapC family toxin [Deltaproteobacteria bacterium]|nr:type II toxin-antitoxin system VapC family toxin [Deltaproteobacteria bacterium]
MVLLDSSAWLEVFYQAPLYKKFLKYLRQEGAWVVSTINLFEVYRKLAKKSEDLALEAVAKMRTGKLIEVTEGLSIEAGDLSIQYQLGMADSLILATAYQEEVTLVTKDYDFHKIPGCKVYR